MLRLWTCFYLIVKTHPFLPSPQFHLSGHAFQTAPPYTPPTTVPARLSPVPSSQFVEAVAAMVQAWYMDESTADPRMPHRAQPDRPVGLEQLRTLGVLYWKVRVQAGAPRACARVRRGGRGGGKSRALRKLSTAAVSRDFCIHREDCRLVAPAFLNGTRSSS